MEAVRTKLFPVPWRVRRGDILCAGPRGFPQGRRDHPDQGTVHHLRLRRPAGQGEAVLVRAVRVNGEGPAHLSLSKGASRRKNRNRTTGLEGEQLAGTSRFPPCI